jgi:hypothetical protein
MDMIAVPGAASGASASVPARTGNGTTTGASTAITTPTRPCAKLILSQFINWSVLVVRKLKNTKG